MICITRDIEDPRVRDNEVLRGQNVVDVTKTPTIPSFVGMGTARDRRPVHPSVPEPEVKRFSKRTNAAFSQPHKPSSSVRAYRLGGVGRKLDVSVHAQHELGDA